MVLISLYEHLKNVLNSSTFLPNIEINMEISATFSNLLRKDAMIYRTKSVMQFPPPSPPPPPSHNIYNSLVRIVNHLIREERLLIRCLDRNLLGLGMVQEINSLPPNSLLQIISNNEDWTLLYCLIGEWNFSLLLLNSTILIRVDGAGTLNQISGPPLSTYTKGRGGGGSGGEKLKIKYHRHHILYSTFPPPQQQQQQQQHTLIEEIILKRIKKDSELKISLPTWIYKSISTNSSRIACIYEHHFPLPSSQPPPLKTVTYRQVLQFLHSVIRKILPSYGNEDKKMVERFVVMRKFETLPIAPFIGAIVIPLLRGFFYITEHGGNQNDKRLHYYPLDQWRIISMSSFDYLIDKLSLVIIDSTNHSSNIARKIRLLPKLDGGTFRPISRLTSHAKKNQLRNINVILREVLEESPTRKVLEESIRVSLRGGIADIDLRINNYLTKNDSSSVNYFSKFDIKEFYDSIEHQLLLEFLQESLSCKNYIINRYDIIKKNGNIKWIKSCKDISHFKGEKGSIMVDRHDSISFSSFQIIKIIKEHICDERISLLSHSHLKNTYYQKRGIPQGSPVSSSLGALYYERLDALFFSKFISSSNLLMRYVDDMIFITKSFEEYRNFSMMMMNGFGEDFNFQINYTKALLSHPIDGLPFKVLEEGKDEAFPWCGILIGRRGLSCEVDYSPLYDVKYVPNSLYINWAPLLLLNVDISLILKKYSISWVKCRLSPIFLTERQDLLIVHKMIFKALLICSMKISSFIRELREVTHVEVSNQMISEVIVHLTNFVICRLRRIRGGGGGGGGGGGDKSCHQKDDEGDSNLKRLCLQAFKAGCKRGDGGGKEEKKFISWMWLEEKMLKHHLRWRS